VRLANSHAYLVLAVAGSIAFAAVVGEYWLTDAMVLGVLAVGVAYFCFVSPTTQEDTDKVRTLLTPGPSSMMPLQRRRGKTKAVPASKGPAHIRGSRIAHYFVVSRLKSTERVADTTDSPFEQALLRHPGWRSLSGMELEDFVKTAQEIQMQAGSGEPGAAK